MAHEGGSFKQNGHNVVVGDAAYFTSYAGKGKGVMQVSNAQ